MNRVLSGIIRLEWRYQVRQLTFAVAALGFTGWAFALIGTGYGPENAAVNSPHVIMQSMGLLTLPVIFLVTITCTGAALRDVEYGMAELVWSTPAGRLNYLAGRFGGAMLGALTVLAFASVGLALAPHLLPVPAARMGAPGILPYLWAFVLIAVPGTLLFGSIIFAVAALTRSAVASYVGGVALYALYFVTALLVDSPLMADAAQATPEALARAAILDPLGLSAFFEQTRYWDSTARNTQMLSLSGHLLWNRLLWLSVTVATLLLVVWRFSFRLPSPRAGREPRRLAQALGALRAHAPYAALVALWIFLAGMELWTGSRNAEYHTALYPTTGFLLNAMLQPLAMFGTLVVLWFTADLVWRDRATRMADIVDATPASSVRFYLRRLATLAAVIGGLVALTIVVGLSVQLVRDYRPLELGLWTSLFVVAGVPLLLLAVLALLIQALSPNRWVGLLLSLALVIGFAQAGNSAVLSHPMLRYGSAPALKWSDMNGYGAALTSWSWFMAAWTAGALVLAVVTIGLWPRGRATLRARGRRMARTLGPAGRLAGAAASLAFVALAGTVWYRTTAGNRYETADERTQWKASYERTWRRTASAPTPVIVAVTTAVDLYPREQRYTMRGMATLANVTGRPIDTVYVVTRRDIDTRNLALAGANRVAFDSVYGVSTFVLARSLAPDERAELAFDLEFTDAGLRADGYDNTIVPNGSFIMSSQVLPSVGYRASYEVRSKTRRRELGLAAASAIGALDTTGLSRAARNEAWATLDATISTEPDQQVVASGDLVRQWEAGGRRYFRYVMDRPMTGRFGFASARYRVERVRHGDVDVELYYHPAHGANIPAMRAAATRSLDYFSRVFGPYQYPVLRIAEVPSYLDAGALALPGVIYFVENRGYLTDIRDSTRFDIITRRMAHEVSHQWWGHQLSPADVEGATMLVETLAKYSEQLVLRERRGAPALVPLLQVDEDRYRQGAAEEVDEEPGLYRVADQDYIYYGKGGVVMHQLEDSLGEAALTHALTTLLQQHGGAVAPPATTLDLLGILHAQMPASKRAFIDRSLKEAGLITMSGSR